jgi:hypothetical protein
MCKKVNDSEMKKIKQKLQKAKEILKSKIIKLLNIGKLLLILL